MKTNDFNEAGSNRDAYQRDYDSSVSGMGRPDDHRGLRQELAHETNNIAVYINGKLWKVWAGKGTADSREERAYLNSMKGWADKKSAATGKKWTVGLTGANVSEAASAAVRMQRAADKQRAKSDASLARTPSSIPKKEEPKQPSDQKGVAEEQVNELSKGTLKSYSKSAGQDVHADQRDAGGARDQAAHSKKHGDVKQSAAWKDEAEWLDNRAEKRAGGVARATTKIAQKGVAEAEKNPHTSALGKALYRDLSKEKKVSPEQVEKNKANWAKNPHNPANKQQGMAEDSKKTPGVALSKTYTKDFDGKKPKAKQPEDIALSAAYSKTGKPGGPLVKEQGVTEMDSQGYRGSRDSVEDDAGKKEYYGKAVTAKDVTKKASSILDKAFKGNYSDEEHPIRDDGNEGMPGKQRYPGKLKPKGVAEEVSNPEDRICVDVPLFIRLMEYAREDAETDMDLHSMAERLTAMSASGETLGMDSYDAVVGSEAPVEEASLAQMRDYFDQPDNNTVKIDNQYSAPERKTQAHVPPEIQALINKMYRIGKITPQEFETLKNFQLKTKINVGLNIKEADKNPYAIGMASAMKSTGDNPPLKKSTINKAHEIARAVKKGD